MDLKQLLLTVLILFMVLIGFHGEATAGELSYNFYDETCPQLESIVRTGVQSVTFTDPTTPAALLRLMFHDCQVQGCDASILVDPDGTDETKNSEMKSSRNFAIRKRDTIGLIKSTVESMCPQQVSCSDILVLAAREAVALSGGPSIAVPLGRRDSSGPPDFRSADASLPPADIGVDEMLRLFANKGMTVEESVAILGAHTLGVTHCVSLQSRLQNHQQNTPLNPLFANTLRMNCPLQGSSPASTIAFVQNDLTSAFFDNQYFANTMSGRGVLNVDAQMPLDPRTAPFVQNFAVDRDAFFRAFSSAFVKLSSSGVLTGSQGVVRRRCDALN